MSAVRAFLSRIFRATRDDYADIVPPVTEESLRGYYRALGPGHEEVT